MLSNDFGKTWKNVEKEGDTIIVIVPGAGVYNNQFAFDNLKRHYNVVFIDANNRKDGFDYPTNWRNNDRLNLKRDDNKGLMGLTNRVGEYIMKDPPCVIICGSRGSQVTMGLVWKHYWRGPSICINAGPLTSKSHIYRGVYPIMITMENDYFRTGEKTQLKFGNISEVDGLNIYRLNDFHVPNLYNPKQFLLNVVKVAVSRGKLALGIDTNYIVSNLKGELKPKLIYTVNSKYGCTKLRQYAKSERNNFTYDVKNGTKVIVLDNSVDEKGYIMLFVNVYNDISMKGWIYMCNIKELQK